MSRQIRIWKSTYFFFEKGRYFLSTFFVINIRFAFYIIIFHIKYYGLNSIDVTIFEEIISPLYYRVIAL